MSEIGEQIEVIQFIQLKQKLFKRNLTEDIEDFTKNIIMDIVHDLEETKNVWCEKWK